MGVLSRAGGARTSRRAAVAVSEAPNANGAAGEPRCSRQSVRDTLEGRSFAETAICWMVAGSVRWLGCFGGQVLAVRGPHGLPVDAKLACHRGRELRVGFGDQQLEVSRPRS